MRIEKIILCLFFLMPAVLPLFSADENQGKPKLPEVCVRGIMYDTASPIAIVNDESFGLGEEINGVKILQISESKVTFEYNGERFDRTIGEGCKKELRASVQHSSSTTRRTTSSSVKKPQSASRRTSSRVSKFTAMPLLTGPLFGIAFSIAIILYVYSAVVLQRLALKTGVEHGYLAWIPVANIFLLCMIAKRSFLWLLILFVPYVGGIIFCIVIWGGVAEACNKPWWLSILMLLPVVNLIIMGHLAFSSDSVNIPPKPELPRT